MGSFIISLDFELHWGIFESKPADSEIFDNTRNGILLLLDLFNKHNIHATWATVGFLFSGSKEELFKFLPIDKPKYKRKNISSYNIFDQIGNSESDDLSHYAKSIILRINNTPFQEVATHTFSHYYASEEGQELVTFEQDIDAAIKIANECNIELYSLVFPRNQINREYLSILKQKNIHVVRSNPKAWFYNASQSTKSYNSSLKKIMRGLDLIIPLCNTHFTKLTISDTKPLAIPASRFLRPYKKKDFVFNKLKLNRIKNEMTMAAKKKRNYHLWWHPHNFGEELSSNLKYLEEIIIHYKELNAKYEFQSMNMKEFYDYCIKH